MDKTEVARRQLGTALALYLDHRDPVSVHCLVCGGCEIAEQLAERASQPRFRKFTLAYYPEMSGKAFVTLRNRFWNAFKHDRARDGSERNDTALLDSFSERENEERLFVGWFDYGSATSSLPIEAQVFSTWFLALNPERFAPDCQDFLAQVTKQFPNLETLSPNRQRKRLRRAIEKARGDRTLLQDCRTDRRPLMLD